MVSNIVIKDSNNQNVVYKNIENIILKNEDGEDLMFVLKTEGNRRIVVVDYDGTVIDDRRLFSGQKYKLPTAPVHEKLTFQEWVCQAEIVDGLLTMPDYNIVVGASYTKNDGLTEIVVELNENTGNTVNLKMDGTKNWGDGVSNTSKSHTYSNYGKYTITCDGTNFDNFSASVGLFGQSQSLSNGYVKSVLFGNITKVAKYCVAYCDAIEEVFIPYGVSTVEENTVQRCRRLTALIIPNSVTTLGYSLARECTCLKFQVLSNNLDKINSSQANGNPYMEIINYPNPRLESSVNNDLMSIGAVEELILPEKLTSIGLNSFSSCYALKRVVFLGDVKSFSSAFTNQSFYNLQYISFPNCSSVPKITVTQYTGTSFTGIPKSVKIYVPDVLYSEWKTTQYWDAYAGQIYKISEMPIE